MTIFLSILKYYLMVGLIDAFYIKVVHWKDATWYMTFYSIFAWPWTMYRMIRLNVIRSRY